MNLNTQRNSESITNNMARAKAERQTLGAKTGDENQANPTATPVVEVEKISDMEPMDKITGLNNVAPSHDQIYAIDESEKWSRPLISKLVGISMPFKMFTPSTSTESLNKIEVSDAWFDYDSAGSSQQMSPRAQSSFEFDLKPDFDMNWDY